MNILFYVSAVVAILSTAMVITRLNAVHALLNMIVSLMAVALVFFSLGAPFVAALEVIVYAGAIMVLFIFVIMMMNQGPHAVEQEALLLTPGAWVVPSALSLVMMGEVFFVITSKTVRFGESGVVAPVRVGLALFGPYLLAVELASILLLAGLVAAYHLGRREETEAEAPR